MLRWMIDLHCCNYYHLLSNFSSNLQSFMTIFHHGLVTIQILPNFNKLFQELALDELKVIWENNICNIMHKMYH